MNAQSVHLDQSRPVYRLASALVMLSAGSREASLMSLEMFNDADSSTLAVIADSAGTLQRTLHIGMAGIGRCLAYAAPDAIDSSQCSENTIEAVGWLLAEIADMAAICHHLEVTARRVLKSLEIQDDYVEGGAN